MLSVVVVVVALVARASSSANVLSLLHLTDMHYDPYYAVHASTATFCHDHSLQRVGSQHAFRSTANVTASRTHRLDNDEQKAGKYGAISSQCDSPLSLIQLATEFVEEKHSEGRVHSPKWLLLTGDTARHNRDPALVRPKREVFDQNHEIFRKLHLAMGNQRAILPSLGNLDVHPHNQLVFDSPVLHELARVITPFIYPPIVSSFAATGSYITEIHPNLHVLSLNTVYLFKDNMMAPDCNLVEWTSPGGQTLEWLESTLRSLRTSSNRSARVILLGHIPPVYPPSTQQYKPACYNRFINILGSYHDIILSMHSGHLNEDTTSFLYRRKKTYRHSEDNSDHHLKGQKRSPYSIMTFAEINGGREMMKMVAADEIELLIPLYMAPSVVPVNNPGIRIMQLNLTSLQWIGWEQYYLSLSIEQPDDSFDYNDNAIVDSNNEDDNNSILNESSLTKLKYHLHSHKDKKMKSKRRKHRHRPHPSPHPQFLLEYETNIAYGMRNLSLTNWSALIKRAANKDSKDGAQLMELYNRYRFVRGSPPRSSRVH